MNRRNPKTQILPPLPGQPLTRRALPALPGHHETRLTNHARKILLLWEPLNALHEVLVTIPVGRNNLSNKRNRAERPPLVHGVEERVMQIRREFQASEDAARLENAEGLAQRDVFVREIPDAESDGVEIYAGVWNA